MTQISLAARSHVRNLVLCALATLTLAACGSEDGSSGAAAAAAVSPSSDTVASTNVGMINRSAGTDTSDTTAPSTAADTSTTTTTASNTASGSTSTTTTAGTGTTTSGVATLDWMPPTENTDGSALTNLAGYTVYYGTSPDNLTQSVKVTNPGLTAYTVTNLTSGTWYFVVTSYSATGAESSRTGTVSTTI